MSDVHNLEESSVKVAPPGDLASRLASRICHDLTNPIGAIANGLELLLLSGTAPTPEIDLIAQSVESANARLRFFRLAYGAASQQPVGRTEVVRILTALGHGSRYSYDWAADGDCPRIEVKAIFLLLQCLETTLPLGGKLRLVRDGDCWLISAAGPRVRTDTMAWRALALPTVMAEDATEVPFALLAIVLLEMGRSLTLSSTADRVEARF